MIWYSRRQTRRKNMAHTKNCIELKRTKWTKREKKEPKGESFELIFWRCRRRMLQTHSHTRIRVLQKRMRTEKKKKINFFHANSPSWKLLKLCLVPLPLPCRSQEFAKPFILFFCLFVLCNQRQSCEYIASKFSPFCTHFVIKLILCRLASDDDNENETDSCATKPTIKSEKKNEKEKRVATFFVLLHCIELVSPFSKCKLMATTGNIN